MSWLLSFLCAPLLFLTLVLVLYIMLLRIILNKGGKSRHLVLFLILVDPHWVFLYLDNVGYRFVILVFNMLRYVLPISDFLRIYTLKRCWILSKRLSCIYWDGHVISTFVCLCDRFIDFYMLNHSCISRMKSTWSQEMICIECILEFRG